MAKDKKSGGISRKMRRDHIATIFYVYFLYDSTLTLQEAFVMAEVFALDHENGCRAMNKHFAPMLRVEPDQVGKIISALVQKGRLERAISPSGEGKKRFLSVVRLGPSHRVKRPDGHPVDPPYPYGENTGTHTAKTPDAILDENNKGGNKEREGETHSSPPPHLSEAEERKKLERKALTDKGLDAEERSRFSYLNSKASCLGLSEEFFAFFASEVLGRFDKYCVKDVVLQDWCSQLYEKYGHEVAAKAMSEYSVISSGWSPKLAKVVEMAKNIGEERKKLEAGREAAKKRQEERDTQRRQAENGMADREKFRVTSKSIAELRGMLKTFRGDEFQCLRIQKQIDKLEYEANRVDYEAKTK